MITAANNRGADAPPSGDAPPAFGALLGLSADEIAELVASGIIH